jgi:DmsE family decaheme c-type cytochrome
MGNKCPKSAARMGATWGGDVDRRNGGRRVKRASLIAQALVLAALFGFAEQAKAEPGQSLSLDQVRSAVTGAVATDTQNFHREVYRDDAYSALRQYVQEIRNDGSDLRNFVGAIESEQPQGVSLVGSQDSHHQFNDEAYLALRDFAQQIGTAQQDSFGAPQLQVAEADNAFDALRDFLGGNGAQPNSTPGATPKQSPKQSMPTKVKRDPAAINATYVGANTCLKCHASQAAVFDKTLMGKIGKTQKGKFDCENCHGPGSAHVKAGGGRGVGGIISFRPEDDSRTVEENNAICLNCHQKGDRTLWKGSTHEIRGIACTNCHTIMKEVSRKNQLKTAFQPDTCFQCHENKRAQIWRTSHMPVREGKMTCTDCHNPHGSFAEHLLKQATVNDTCYQCHAEKRGPFLWEHPPVREDCLNCHDPHGSNNDFLLKISRPRLCQQCHSGGVHNSNPRNPQVTLYAQGRECQHCHSNHHGSNSPNGARFMR